MYMCVYMYCVHMYVCINSNMNAWEEREDCEVTAGSCHLPPR